MNRLTKLAIALSASVLTITPAAMAQKPTAQDVSFMKKAAQGNVAEVMTGKLALQKSQDQGVRKLANMLIMEHSAANTQLKQAAAARDVSLPSMPNPMQKQMYRRLSRLSGASFDKAYMKGNVKAHLDAIGLYRKEIQVGKDAAALKYASETLPKVENHTSMIVTVAENVGATPLPQAARAYKRFQRGGSAMKGM